MPRVRRRLGSIDDELIPVPLGKPSYEDLVSVGFLSSELVIEMRNAEPEVILLLQSGEEVEENYRVYPAADRDNYRITSPEERFLPAVTLKSIGEWDFPVHGRTLMIEV
jgi:hypothetical protein